MSQFRPCVLWVLHSAGSINAKRITKREGWKSPRNVPRIILPPLLLRSGNGVIAVGSQPRTENRDKHQDPMERRDQASLVEKAVPEAGGSVI
jgi:hypothetical protein